MKKQILIWLFICVALLMVPLSVLWDESSLTASTQLQSGQNLPPVTDGTALLTDTPSGSLEDTQPQSNDVFTGAPETFLVYNHTTQRVESVSDVDFIRGAIAAEMPGVFHIEALKAQGVAAYTFAVRQAMIQQESPDPLLEGAHFSADPPNLQVYMTRNEAEEFYGEDFYIYWTKVTRAAQEVMGYILLYEEQPAATAYHAISAGQTESAANIWDGEPLPYLQSVESSWDELSPGYETVLTFTSDELQEFMLEYNPNTIFQQDPSLWFSNLEHSNSGYVTSVSVGDQVLSGLELRNLLGLRSSHFDVEYNGNFIFTVRGYGHGAGLSQNGADYMARQGSTFDEILMHYYPDTTLALATN